MSQDTIGPVIFKFVQVVEYLSIPAFCEILQNDHVSYTSEDGLPSVLVVKNLPAMQEPQEMWVHFLG